VTSGNAFLTLSDNPGNGVNILSAGLASVDACGISSLSFTAGSSANIACGSVFIEVVSGSVDVTFVGDDGTTATTTLTEDDDVTFEQDTLVFTNNGDDPVTIIINDEEEQTIPPGDTFTLLTEIIIDIKPGSDDNSINTKSKGVIPVSVLSTESFDATSLDIDTIVFGPGDALESHNELHIEDVNDDGLDDVILHFKTQDLGLTDETQLELRGQTNDGTPVKGLDEITLKN
jgi:hypothetical protein